MDCAVRAGREKGTSAFLSRDVASDPLLQQWFGLSDAAMEETLYDLPLYRVFSGTDVLEDQRSAAREGVDAAFGYGRRCRADQRAEFDPEPAQGGRPRNASDQERPAGVLWDESA